MQFVIAREDPRAPDVAGLIRDLDRLMVALYPADSNHLVAPEALSGPETVFLVAREDGAAAGCGAFRRIGPGHGELKRMWVRPAWRGRGLGRDILAELERHARAAGIDRLSLETGNQQPEAIGLYRSAGYRDCAPFGAYTPDPLSLFMTKEIA
jgi:putative acetyltransferase